MEEAEQVEADQTKRPVRKPWRKKRVGALGPVKATATLAGTMTVMAAGTMVAGTMTVMAAGTMAGGGSGRLRAMPMPGPKAGTMAGPMPGTMAGPVVAIGQAGLIPASGMMSGQRKAMVTNFEVHCVISDQYNSTIVAARCGHLLDFKVIRHNNQCFNFYLPVAVAAFFCSECFCKDRSYAQQLIEAWIAALISQNSQRNLCKMVSLSWLEFYYWPPPWCKLVRRHAVNVDCAGLSELCCADCYQPVSWSFDVPVMRRFIFECGLNEHPFSPANVGINIQSWCFRLPCCWRLHASQGSRGQTGNVEVSQSEPHSCCVATVLESWNSGVSESRWWFMKPVSIEMNNWSESRKPLHVIKSYCHDWWGQCFPPI